MVDFTLDAEKGLVTVVPTPGDALSTADFDRIGAEIDTYLQTHEELPGLMIVADKFPGWENFNAFTSHFNFLRGHLKNIKKVAVVSDSILLSSMPALANVFASSRVQRFPVSRRAEAEEWATKKEPRSGRIEVLEGFPDDVVAIKAVGRLTSEDYEETLIPLAEAKLAAKGKIKMLYWCGDDFNGFSMGAAWDDARFGITNIGDIAKLAVVTDIGWIRDSVKMFARLMPPPVRVFPNAEFEAAKAWIIADEEG
jgi:SpoIIAA-like